MRDCVPSREAVALRSLACALFSQNDEIQTFGHRYFFRKPS
jgi:hypothetical protein